MASGALVLSVVVASVFKWRPWISAWERSYEQAQILADSDSLEAERLFRESVAGAGGRFGDAQLSLCRLLARKKRWKEVGELLADIPLKDCQSQLLINFGRQAYVAEQWKVAQPVLAELSLREVFEKREALSLLKAVYGQLGRFGEMQECAKQLTVIAPDDPRAWWDLAQTSEQMGLGRDAVAAYQNVLKHEIPPDASGQVFQRLLNLLIQSGDAAAARSELIRWTALHGRQPDFSLYEAELYRLEGQSQEALTSIQRYLADGGKSLRALMIRGLLRLELGDAEQAVEDFENVTQREPAYEAAHFKLAEIYRRLGRLELAREHQSEYERIQRIRFEAEEVKKRQRSRLASGADRERLPNLQDRLSPHSEK